MPKKKKKKIRYSKTKNTWEKFEKLSPEVTGVIKKRNEWYRLYSDTHPRNEDMKNVSLGVGSFKKLAPELEEYLKPVTRYQREKPFSPYPKGHRLLSPLEMLDALPDMNESNGQFTILTRPVVFTEKTAILGDEADVMLCDLSQYCVGLRSDMRFDTSIHTHFTTDMLLARLIERHDGQPLWDGVLTLEDGTTEVSPFIKLAERT